jgi:hypothetical protein
MQIGLNASFLFLIAATWIGSYIDGSVPYFPIEISRTAASGRYGYFGLCLGTIVFCPYIQGRADGWISWIGLLILALVDDKMSWNVHMLGVFIMLFGVALSNVNLTLLFLLGLLFFSRVVIRFIVVSAYEVNHVTIHNIIQKNKEIMYSGKCAYPITLLVFKLSGVLQWVCFWGMIQLINN